MSQLLELLGLGLWSKEGKGGVGCRKGGCDSF
jgi:hypothetical protein